MTRVLAKIREAGKVSKPPWHGGKPKPVECEICTWSGRWIKAPGKPYRPCPVCGGPVSPYRVLTEKSSRDPR